MRPFVAIPVALIAALMSMVACAAPERACTLIGAVPGVGVSIDLALAADVTSLRLTVCSGGDCVTGPVVLDPKGTRSGFLTVEALREGPVEVSATAVVSGRQRRYPVVTVIAAPVYPNGPDCGGLGPQAQVTLGPDGLR